MRKKWTVLKKKTCYRNIQLPGGFASFPGAREVSSISGSLPDDPGGITCMYNSRIQNNNLKSQVIYEQYILTTFWSLLLAMLMNEKSKKSNAADISFMGRKSVKTFIRGGRFNFPYVLIL